jgi:Flp pilus assembly pilin Flp
MLKKQGERAMHPIRNFVGKLCKSTLGQDLVEYALLGGLLAVGAGVILPGVSDNVNLLLSRVGSVLTVAAGINPYGPSTSN